ncbi:hypothetical protein [Mycobacterium sp. BK086]|nr:hypothetical protein [Mycobacterium sp. BK086]
MTSMDLTDCAAPDATEKVTDRTNDVTQCPGTWVRSDGSVWCCV